VNGEDTGPESLTGAHHGLELAGLAREPVQLPHEDSLDRPPLEVVEHPAVVGAGDVRPEAGEVRVFVDLDDLPGLALG